MQDKGKSVEIKLALTDEQKRQIADLVQKVGSNQITASVQFEADVDGGTISPATFLVGNAI